MSLFVKNLLIKKEIIIIDDKGIKNTDALHGKVRANDSISVINCINESDIEKKPKIAKGINRRLFLKIKKREIK